MNDTLDRLKNIINEEIIERVKGGFNNSEIAMKQMMFLYRIFNIFTHSKISVAT